MPRLTSRPGAVLSFAFNFDEGSELPAEIRAVFKGLALYSTGTITVAYRQPMVLDSFELGDESIFVREANCGVAANERVAIGFKKRP